MDEETRHELNQIQYPQKEESQYILHNKKESTYKELGEVGKILKAIAVEAEKPSLGQWEKQRSRLMDQIRNGEGHWFTTLKDKCTTTDSLIHRIMICVLIIVIMAALALGALLVVQELLLSPAEASELFSSFLAG